METNDKRLVSDCCIDTPFEPCRSDCPNTGPSFAEAMMTLLGRCSLGSLARALRFLEEHLVTAEPLGH